MLKRLYAYPIRNIAELVEAVEAVKRKWPHAIERDAELSADINDDAYEEANGVTVSDPPGIVSALVVYERVPKPDSIPPVVPTIVFRIEHYTHEVAAHPYTFECSDPNYTNPFVKNRDAEN